MTTSTTIPAPVNYPEPLTFETDGTLLDGYAGAAFSADRTYRYVLTRTWDLMAPVMCWIMLNPSTADAMTDDPTIRRCKAFARREGCGGISVVNLFALRAIDPRELARHPDPVGPSCGKFLNIHATAAITVAAWGAGGTLNGRDREVCALLAKGGAELKCLGVTAAGHPRHPLYVRSDAPLIPWEPPS